MKKEIWKSVDDLSYEVSNLGRIRRSVARTNGKVGHILKGSSGRGGYLKVTLTKPGGIRLTVPIAPLVCRIFHGEKPTPAHQAAHQDGNRKNNRSSNLKWKTQMENELDKRRHGRVMVGSLQPRSKINETDVIAIGALLMTDRFSKEQIASMFGISGGLISHIEFGRNWTHVETPWFQPNRIKNRQIAEAA